jgi:hypothetical protein
MVHACHGSLRAFALNDQQKTAPVYFNLCPYARARGERRQQQGNKATANQSPLALPKESLLPKGRLRANNWVMQRPYDDTVKETVKY